MSSPVRQLNYSGKSVAAFSSISDRNGSGRNGNVVSPMARAANRLTVYTLEFVAKPEQSANAVLHLPAAIQSGLEDMAGFAGSLVMVSDQEARLLTVIILWTGSEAQRSCAQSVRRVRALLAPYLDRCLRAQNMLAHMPASQVLPGKASSIDTRFITGDSIPQEANVCVA